MAGTPSQSGMNPDESSEPGPLTKLLLQGRDQTATQTASTSSQSGMNPDESSEPIPLTKLLQGRDQNATQTASTSSQSGINPDDSGEPIPLTKLLQGRDQNATHTASTSSQSGSQPGWLTKLLLQGRDQNATQTGTSSQSGMNPNESSSSQSGMNPDESSEPGPLMKLLLQRRDQNATHTASTSSPLGMNPDKSSEPGPLMKLLFQGRDQNAAQTASISSQSGMNPDKSSEPGQLMKTLLRGRDQNAIQMASISSQSGMNPDKSSEPGLPMKLLLQGRDQNANINPTIEAKEEKDLSWYLPLYKAALKGDWESAYNFFDRDPDAVTAKITRTSETVLHIAVGTGRAIHFVKNLLELISAPEALETMTDQVGETALHYAAIFGNVEAAKLLVEHSPRLPNTLNKSQLVPLHVAAGYCQRKMVSYLLTVTKDVQPSPFADEPGVKLLNLVIGAEFYDVALQLVQCYPRFASLKSSAGNTALSMLAGKPSAFLSGSRFNFWQRFIYFCVPLKLENSSNNPSGGDVENPTESSQVHAQMCCWFPFFRGNHFFSVCQKLNALFWEVLGRSAAQIKHIQDTKLMHHQTRQLIKCLCTEIMGLDNSKATSIFQPPVLLAARLGIHEVVEEILESFPPAIWSRDKERRDIFQLAVMNRRETVFNLLYQMTEHRHLVIQTRDIKENTILHLAGKLAPPHQLYLVSGAVLQMQRELQWYKEVEKFVQPDNRERENSTGKTPAVLFAEEHKDLVKDGEKWMKDTANSCTVAAGLIATVAFSRAITVPGGNSGGNGLPIFSKEVAFIIFAISNALSLFSSTAALLMFLSILTARYAEADFLYALPKRLIIGLVTLFLSITAMMVTFSATLYLVFGQKKAWVLILVAALACLPVTLFVFLQFPLLVDMIKSTYGPGIFGKKSQRLLY